MTIQHHWYGKPINELDRDELLKVIDYLAKELKWLNNGRLINVPRSHAQPESSTNQQPGSRSHQ